MNQKTIITAIIVAVIFLIGGYFLLKANPSQAPSDQTQNQASLQTQNTETENADNNEASAGISLDIVDINQRHEIIYTDAGYAPANLTIKVGDTVEFKNQSSGGMWPASAMHPTHEVYSGTSLKEHCPDAQNDDFDACQAIATGQSWEFTFKKAGSWGFHDHSKANRFGKITVE